MAKDTLIPNMLEPLQVDAFRDWKGVRNTLSEEWRDLQSDPLTVGANFFNGFDYLDAWVQHFGGDLDLCLLAVRDGHGDLCGLAPLQVSARSSGRWRFRRLGFVRNAHISRCSVLMRGDLRGIAHAIVQRLWHERRLFDDIVLEALPDACPAQTALRHAFVESGFRTRHPPSERQLRTVRMSGTVEEYLASRPASVRKDIRRAHRRCAELPGFEIAVVADPDQARGRLRQLFSLDWLSRTRGRQGAVYPVEAKAFYLSLAGRMAEIGRLEFVEARVAGEVVASGLTITHARRRYLLVFYADPEFDAASPGRAVTVRTITEGVEDPDTDVVELNGSSTLLAQLSDSTLEIGTFFATHDGWRSRLIGLGRAAKARRAARGAVA